MSYALVTGASQGIGRAITFELAKKKQDLLLISRSENELAVLCDTLKKEFNIQANYLCLDLSLSEPGKKIKSWCLEHHYSVSILVNNAGYGLWGKFENMSFESQQNMIQLNIMAMVNITYELLPSLKQNKKAYILNVGSTAGYQAVPTLSIYAATKAFVLFFSRGLRYELRNSPISVSCLSPGSTDTNFINRAGMEALKETADKFSMKPEEVARIAVKGMFDEKSEIVPGFLNKISVLLPKFLPKSIIEKGIASIYGKKL